MGIHRSDAYILISRELAQHENLSLTAKGLFCYLESSGDDWDKSVKTLIKRSPHHEVEAIQQAIQELESAGYLTQSEDS